MRSRTGSAVGPVAARVLAVAAAALLLAGCSSSPGDTDPAPAPTTTAIALPDVTVAVTDAGAAPRRTLALDLAAGSDQQVDLTTTSAITQTVGEQAPQDLSSPELTLPLTAVPAETQDGAVAVALTLGTPTTSDEILTGALAGAQGSGAGLTQRASGALAELRLTPAGNLDDSARAAIEQGLRQATQLAPVLPSQPVGVGAVWTATETIDSLGLLIDQVSTYTLTSLSGDTAELGVAITQTPRSSTWDLPNEGGTLDVVSYPVTGSGTLRVDLRRPLPVGGSLRVGGEQVYSDPASGLVLSQSVEVGVRWG